MDVRALKYFTKVVELGSITRAATQLHIAQPALSRQIRNLEDELGIALIIRESRGVRLTDHGQLLFERAQAILRDVQRARDEVRGSAASPSGTVAVGLVPTLCPVMAPALFATLRSAYPKIELTISENPTVPLLDWLNEGRIDLAILTEPAPTRRFVVERLVKEEMILVTGGKQRVAEPISLERLSETPVIVSSGVRAIMDGLLAQRNFLLATLIEMNSVETIRLMALEGIGPAILPFAIVQRDVGRGDLTAHAIGEGLYRPLATAFARARRLSSAAQVVKDTMGDVVHKLDGDGAFRMTALPVQGEGAR